MQKACGRNEIIALIISFALGRYMTRKQVSSHLQVVRQRKRMNLEGECSSIARYLRDYSYPASPSISVLHSEMSLRSERIGTVWRR